MSCCGRHVRYGVTYIDVEPFAPARRAYGPGARDPQSDFGAVDYACDLSHELAAMSDALEKANALGLYQDPTVISAQALFSANSAMGPMLNSNNCDAIKSGLTSMAARVESLVNAHLPPEQRPGLLDQFQLWVRGLPGWALPVAGVGTGIVALSAVAGGVARGKRGKRRGRR